MGNKCEIENNSLFLNHYIIHQKNVRESGLGRSSEFSFGYTEFKVPVKHPCLYVEQIIGHTYRSKMHKGGLVRNTNL